MSLRHFLAVLLVCGSVIAAEQTPPPYLFGVLIANPKHLESDYAAGIRLALIDAAWDRYEPVRGQYDTAYRDKIADQIRAYREAGFKVAVGVGLHYTPKWIRADAKLQHQSQLPSVTSGMANLVFNQSLRDQAERYIADFVSHMGHVDYYRVGLSVQGETFYPEAPHDEWWAFDPMAQGNEPGRPASIPAPPLPHWVPGTPYEGKTVSTEDAQRWYDWYFNASVDAHEWGIRAHRKAGYTGMIQLPMPGQGVRPDLYRRRIANGLIPAGPKNPDPYHTMNTGAVWFLFLDRLRDKRNLIVDISSVYDRSGTPRGNSCEPGDDNVDYMHDPQVNRWSSTRWISLHARRNGLPIIGENPGHDDLEAMRNAVRLMRECHLVGLMWAFDNELYGGKHATLKDYEALIRECNGGK